jgi:hypothetical protein
MKRFFKMSTEAILSLGIDNLYTYKHVHMYPVKCYFFEARITECKNVERHNVERGQCILHMYMLVFNIWSFNIFIFGNSSFDIFTFGNSSFNIFTFGNTSFNIFTFGNSSFDIFTFFNSRFDIFTFGNSSFDNVKLYRISVPVKRPETFNFMTACKG